MKSPFAAAAGAKWHPATKLLLAAALLAIPFLWWSQPDEGAGVAGAVPREAGGAVPPAVAPPPAALEPYALPPLERFAAVVERPLFSPTRRMPPLAEPVAEAQTEPNVTSEPATTPSDGPEEPELRFFGTVRQGDRVAALVTFPANNAVARLAVGDRVGEWSVLELARNRLVLGLGEERRSFEIFGPGTQPSPAAAAAPPPPDDAEALSPDDAEALPPDEADALPPDDSGMSEEMPEELAPQ